MPVAAPIELRPITRDDTAAVGAFLSASLNDRLSATEWADAVVPPWGGDSPNHGFMLSAPGEIVGVYLAFYSERLVGGRAEKFCNLAAFCVREPYRSHGLRLVRALLGQRGFTFTDLSPSGNVVGLNERLGFTHLDTTTVLRANVPRRSRRGVDITSDPDRIEAALTGEDLRIFRDHRAAAAARHILIRHGADQCYVIARKDRRKRLPLFASVLYATNPDLLRRYLRPFLSHLFWHHGALVTLLEIRVVGFLPSGRMLKRPRPKMFKSKHLDGSAVDYLYSELTCVAW